LPLSTPILAFSALTLLGCSETVRRFPLRDPLWVDNDTAPHKVACRKDPKDSKKQLCMPEEYVSSFAWDAADNTIFRPMSRFWAVDPGGESLNVNSLDEVPDSSWFVNRIGRKPMSLDELAKGSCGKVLDPENAKDGEWLIDKGKANGANPGFRVKVEGIGKFMLKADPLDQPERATGATAIASRVYSAAGWWAPCDSVVYFHPKILKLAKGLTVTDNSGVTKPFDDDALKKLLERASHRGELVRMVASSWLPGPMLGPYQYEKTRDDDSADVVPHEDRRDLRGARVIAAWLNHFDSREQNTMTTWMAENDKDDASPGHVRHWYIDFGDCFGSEWAWEGISKRLGHSYYLDFGHLVADFGTLGIIQRPWDRAERNPDAKLFGFFSANDFEPDAWKGGYPNPAFARMTERDGAWAARILARFTPAHIEAAVKVGDYTDPKHVAYLTNTLKKRHAAILRRYFSKLSPVTDLAVKGSSLCGVDLALSSGLFSGFSYRATVRTGDKLDVRSNATVTATATEVCVPLTHQSTQYVLVELTNGQAPGMLRAHLYDLGPDKGFKLVGVERPDP
jgi:hypothetical protein